MDELNKIFNQHIFETQRKVLRRNLSQPEKKLWSKLRCEQLNYCKFRRQYGVENYVVDFYCPKLKLAIEIDGNSHYGLEARKLDKDRQAFIESFGIGFLRFTNKEVMENIDGVLAEIVREIEAINPT